jgi:hypothetical protein
MEQNYSEQYLQWFKYASLQNMKTQAPGRPKRKPNNMT